MRVLRTLPARADCPVALTIGNFDGVHRGHQAMLERLKHAANARSIPSAVMTFEPHPREFFAPDQAPTRLSSLREKLEAFAAAGVDRAIVCKFDYDLARTPPEVFVERVLARGLGVRWLLIGDDFRFGARRAGDLSLLKRLAPQYGYDVEPMASVMVGGQRVSSTVIRDALRDGRLAVAQELLGRAYAISGRVVPGNRIGRTLGFPTANVRMRRNRPPLLGIFVVRVHGLGPVPVPGAASLGFRPTVESRAAPVLEVHLLDFDADIYGRRVRVEFLHKLRDELRFPDIDSLRAQIALDVAAARDFLRAHGAPAAAARRAV